MHALVQTIIVGESQKLRNSSRLRQNVLSAQNICGVSFVLGFFNRSVASFALSSESSLTVKHLICRRQTSAETDLVLLINDVRFYRLCHLRRNLDVVVVFFFLIAKVVINS